MGLRIRVEKRLRHFRLEIDLCCPSGMLTCMLGPSGAGKTTLVRLLAGLERPDSGSILANGRAWFDASAGKFTPPQRRNVGYVFQEYTLLPHLDLRRNVGFAARDAAAVEHYMRRFDIWKLRDRKPHRLSGGERQRGALAQALARHPAALLLDEPFSALDFRTREVLHATLAETLEEQAVPALLVTHDVYEAHALTRRCFCMVDGVLRPDWLNGLAPRLRDAA
jgi:molybdate transport system ATP-binding protein